MSEFLWGQATLSEHLYSMRQQINELRYPQGDSGEIERDCTIVDAGEQKIAVQLRSSHDGRADFETTIGAESTVYYVDTVKPYIRKVIWSNGLLLQTEVVLPSADGTVRATAEQPSAPTAEILPAEQGLEIIKECQFIVAGIHTVLMGNSRSCPIAAE